MNKKKVIKFIKSTFPKDQLKENPVLKMSYKSGKIEETFDFVLNNGDKESLINVEKLNKTSIEVLTKKYIFANKLIDEMDLESRTFVLIVLGREEDLIEQLILSVEFANNYLFHNRGIKFKVIDFFELKRLGLSVSNNERINNLIE